MNINKPALEKFLGSIQKLATKQDLRKLGAQIMSAIKDATDKFNAALDRIKAVGDGLTTSFDGIKDDLLYLKEVIDKLQNNVGPISPEDQALLDQATARSEESATRLEAFGQALEELNKATERPPTT